MGKSWSLLFGATMLACLLLFVVAPFVKDWWLPEDVSDHGKHIDFLYYVILAITGFFFIVTEAILVYFMYRYAGQPGVTPPPLSPSVFTGVLKPVTSVLNEPHKIELAWTIIPAAILLYIAFAQVNTWASVKYHTGYFEFIKESGNKVPVVAEVSARQFEWRMRYPSAKRMKAFLEGQNTTDFNSFGKITQFDDVYVVNELHAIKGHPSLVHLSTRDVIHSFNMPHLRIKQDALPGKVIPVWFKPVKSNTKFVDDKKSMRWEDKPEWDIACAELCGWGHYRMIGRIFVHENKEDFLKWLQHVEDDQNLGKPKQQ